MANTISRKEFTNPFSRKLKPVKQQFRIQKQDTSILPKPPKLLTPHKTLSSTASHLCNPGFSYSIRSLTTFE